MATGAWQQDAITTQTTQTELLKPAWKDVINDTYMSRAPMVSLLTAMGSHEKIDRDKWNWATYKEKLEYVTVETNAGGVGAIITVSATDVEKIAKYQVLRNSRNGQYYYVTTTVRSDNITAATFTASQLNNSSETIMKAISTTDCITGDTLYILNKVAPEKWADITNVANYTTFKTEDTDYNYVEMMFDLLELSDLEANSGKWVSGSERSRNMGRAQQRLWQAFETKCFTGVRAKNQKTIADDTYTGFMGGIDAFSGLNTETDILSGYTWANFKDWIKSEMQVWQDKPRLMAYCNNNMFYKITQWVANNSDPTFSAAGYDDTFGYQVQTIKTPGPTLECVNNRALFEAFGNSAVMYIVDMDLLSIKYFGGNEDSFGFEVLTNCQLKGNNNLVDKLSFWPTLEVLNPERMGKLLLTA